MAARTGKVLFFSPAKGYGFIAKSDGSGDIFVHYSGIEGEGYRTLEKDAQVEFEMGEGPNGKPQAVNVRVIQ